MSNEALWRNMVLSRFDFSTDPRVFNVKDWDGYPWDEESDLDDDKGDHPRFADWHRQPWNGPIDEWAAEHPTLTKPTHVLWHGMRYWPAMTTNFRPMAYEFLGKIQQDRTLLATLWPSDEDAYSLFRDLLLLPRFHTTPDREFYTTCAADEHASCACLMGRFPAKITGEGFAMLKICDFAPHYWYINYWRAKFEPASTRWTGRRARKQPAVCDCIDCYNCRKCRSDDYSLLPGTRGSSLVLSDLRRFVYETFSDWRHVEIYDQLLYAPIFHIGKTKQSGRWLGFVGRLDPCE